LRFTFWLEGISLDKEGHRKWRQ